MFSVRYLMYQCVPCIRKSLQLLILFDIMQFDNMLQKFFNCSFKLGLLGKGKIDISNSI